MNVMDIANVTAYQHWRIETDADGIAWATLDKLGETTNSLSVAVMDELAKILAQFESKPPKALIFRSDILNLHSLSDLRLKSLLKSLEQCEVDDYTAYAPETPRAADDYTESAANSAVPQWFLVLPDGRSLDIGTPDSLARAAAGTWASG